MTLAGLALVLTAAVCHATWNYFVKRINGGPELIWLFSVIAAALYLPVVAAVVLVDRPPLGLAEAGVICGSVLLHLGYFLLLQRGYREGDLSIVYPTARATGPVLATTFAVAALGEPMSLQIAAGGIAIIFGIFRLTGGPERGPRRVGRSVRFGLAAGLLIASYTIWDSRAVSVLLIPPLVLDYASSIGRVVLLSPVAWKRRDLVARHWHGHRWAVVAIAVFNPLAYILVLYALTFTPVVYVAPLRETSVLLTVLMGSVLLGEGALGRRLGWSAVILAGVALLATAK